MSFNNIEYISDRIRVTSSYKEISSLRDQIWTLSGKIEFGQFVDLRDKVEKKINEFNRPIFDDAKVNVKFQDGRLITIDSREINLIVGKGIRLSEYIFGEHPEASDFEIIYGGFEDPLDKYSGDELDESRIELSGGSRIGSMREGVERIIKLALKLVNFLFSAYSRSFPNIAEDLKVIKIRLEELFEKVSSTYF